MATGVFAYLPCGQCNETFFMSQGLPMAPGAAGAAGLHARQTKRPGREHVTTPNQQGAVCIVLESLSKPNAAEREVKSDGEDTPPTSAMGP